MPSRATPPLGLGIAACIACLTTAALDASGQLLLERARRAAARNAGAAAQSIEIKGTTTDGNSPGVMGRLAVRIKLPDHFLLIEGWPGRRASIAALTGPTSWGRSGEREYPLSDDAHRRVSRRFNRWCLSYLLQLPGACLAAAVGTNLQVGEECGGFRAEFDSTTLRLRAITYRALFIPGGAVELGEFLSSTTAERAKARLERAKEVEIATAYSDYRVVSGWQLPFATITKDVSGYDHFAIESVAVNPRLSVEDFTPGRSVSELQRWVESIGR